MSHICKPMAHDTKGMTLVRWLAALAIMTWPETVLAQFVAEGCASGGPDLTGTFNVTLHLDAGTQAGDSILAVLFTSFSAGLSVVGPVDDGANVYTVGAPNASGVSGSYWVFPSWTRADAGTTQISVAAVPTTGTVSLAILYAVVVRQGLLNVSTGALASPATVLTVTTPVSLDAGTLLVATALGAHSTPTLLPPFQLADQCQGSSLGWMLAPATGVASASFDAGALQSAVALLAWYGAGSIDAGAFVDAGTTPDGGPAVADSGAGANADSGNSANADSGADAAKGSDAGRADIAYTVGCSCRQSAGTWFVVVLVAGLLLRRRTYRGPTPL